MLRSTALLLSGALLFLLFGTWLAPPVAFGEEAPPELRAAPARPTRTAKEVSRPMIEATKRVLPSVVKIDTFRTFRGRWVQAQSGSGFVISRSGHVLTNRHVVNGAQELLAKASDGQIFQLEVLGSDPRSDVAVCRIRGEVPESLPVAVLGDSDELEVGEIVLAIGAPFEQESSVSMGVVSAFGRAGFIGHRASEDFIQTDASLNPGNSGGPLVNLDGQVVAINTAITSRSRESAGVGYSIPINLARAIATALVESGVVRHGYLGVDGTWLRAVELQQRGIPSQGGLVISRVLEGSPAAKAGLQEGEVVTEVDDRPLRDERILFARLAQKGPGGRILLKVHGTDAKARTVSVTLGEEPLYTYGIEVESLGAERRRQLGLPNSATGVVVTRILDGSVASLQKGSNRLLPGDVIVRIDWHAGSERIEDKEDFEEVMARLKTDRPRAIRLVILTKEGLYNVIVRP